MIRPLSNSIIAPIVESTGWTKDYTLGVLLVWKSRDAYCQAVLHYAHRHDLNGTVTTEEVNDHARQQAKLRLEENAAARARRQEKEASKRTSSDAPAVQEQAAAA